MDIGNGLKKLRKEKGITQIELGDKIGLSSQYISDVERGRNTPTDKTIKKILEPFNISYVDFLIDYCGVKRAGAPEGETAAEGKARLQREEIEFLQKEYQDNIDETIIESKKDLIEEITNIIAEGSIKEYELFRGIADYFDMDNTEDTNKP